MSKALENSSLAKRNIPGAKTVPRDHANKNKTAKTNENMQFSAIKSIENTLENPI